MGSGTSPVGRNGRVTGTKSKPAIRPNGRYGDGVSYADVPAELVHSIVKAVASAGGAMMFGQTRDGGAFSLCVLMGDEKIKEYPRDADEIRRFLTWLSEEYLA